MRCEWTFHSKQLTLDAAVLLTEVESALSPSTPVECRPPLLLRHSCCTHTRCPCQRLDLSAGITFFLTATRACCKWKVINLLRVVEG